MSEALLMPLGAPDADLLRRIAGGDRGALESLYREHAGWLVVRLERRCDDPELADQALQDTFVAVWRSAGTWRGEGDVGAWLWGIAMRRLIDLLRKQKPHQIDTTENLPEPSAEQTAMDRRLSGPLATAVSKLDPDLRDVFLLANLDQLTTREIASLRQIPQGTVKTRLARARRVLQTELTTPQQGDAA